MTSKRRIESLDWLRGFMALSIMVYHLTGWVFNMKWESNSLLGKLGIYSVSAFFLLSGLSMAIVYNRYITNFTTSIKFFIRRLFRIWPLLWICIALSVIPFILKNGFIGIANPWKIFINMTTLFGFIDPSNYINSGAWSIGNEMVYYALTPITIILFNKKLMYGNFLLFITFLISILFSFSFLDITKNLSNQWLIYINPFNNFVLYVLGVATYYNFNKIKISLIAFWTSLIFSISIFMFFPVSGDQINIVTGSNRIIFMVASFLLVLSFYKLPNEIECKIPKILSSSFEQFGIATYGIYLLHPIVLFYWQRIIERLHIHNNYFTFFGCIILTIAASLISFNFIESKIMAIGKKITL